ncbi:MAG: hypothetical protein C4549_06460 [Deltaproteobacteria bacterium]|nr:MAG: hypothetical protein C4549_06460 [Deltaproteobacteria bacterium]
MKKILIIDDEENYHLIKHLIVIKRYNYAPTTIAFVGGGIGLASLRSLVWNVFDNRDICPDP